MTIVGFLAVLEFENCRPLSCIKHCALCICVVAQMQVPVLRGVAVIKSLCVQYDDAAFE